MKITNDAVFFKKEYTLNLSIYELKKNLIDTTEFT